MPGLRGDLGPDRARPPGHVPAVAGFLAGDGDEAEIADRRAIRLRVPVDDDDLLASPRGRESMGKAEDAGTDDGQVEHEGILVGIVGDR